LPSNAEIFALLFDASQDTFYHCKKLSI